VKVAPLLASPVTLPTLSVPNSLLSFWAEAGPAPAPPTRPTIAIVTAAASSRVERPNMRGPLV